VKRPVMAAFATVAVACGMLGTGAVEPALAATHTIGVSGPSTGSIGQTVLLQASGTAAPPGEWWDLSYLEVVVLSAQSIGECPPDAQDAAVLGETGAGSIIAIALRPALDELGNYTNTVGFTPASVGTDLVCAYIEDEVGYTYAADSLRITIGGGSPGGAQGTETAGSGAPMNVARPRVSRSGRRLVCHPGSWSNVSGRYAFRWYFDGRPSVSGRTAWLTGDVSGHKAKCRVTASGPGGSASATSPVLRL